MINRDNLSIILNHFYNEEIKSLEEELENSLPDDLDEAIKDVENNNKTDHIAYNLMLLKQDLQK